jgi:hypothetical protein
MAISVVCDNCGKRLNVKEELVGKKVKCPACKTAFTASPSGAIRVKKVDKGKSGAVAISWGFVSMIAGGIAVVGLVLMIVFGPVRAKGKWDPMAAKAEDDIRDVVERGLQVEMERKGEWSPGAKGQAPNVFEVHMLWDMMVMSLPEFIKFKGTTTEGEYTGTYNTKTLEVVADVEIGGHVVPGVGEAAVHGNQKAKVNGWNKDGDFKVWVDGTPAEFKAAKATKPKRKSATELPVAPGL